ALTMSAMTSASKPSGAPTKSSRPGSAATRRNSAAVIGRTLASSATGVASLRVNFQPKRLDLVQQVAFELGRRPQESDDPAVEILVGLVEQALELVELGLAHALDVLVRKRPQDEVRFPEAPAPRTEPQLLQPGVVTRHSKEGPDIERAWRKRQSAMLVSCGR